jgi:hypothetical protein
MLQPSRLSGFGALAVLAALSVNLPATAQATGTGAQRATALMKIRITSGTTVLTGTLLDNPTARDFASLLPLTTILTDYAKTEKISDLPRKLTTSAAPAASTPAAGTIAYYAPWGNLAFFYKPFARSNGLILLGSIDTDIGLLARSGSLDVKVELISD